jgi:hypothetical protein
MSTVTPPVSVTAEVASTTDSPQSNELFFCDICDKPFAKGEFDIYLADIY